jgi:hypothetical protein
VTETGLGEGWISLADAAPALGVSIHAVRRRVRQGTLPARRVQTRYGPAWMVQLEGERNGSATVTPPLRDPGAHPGATAADALLSAHVADLIRGLQAQLLARTEAATTWQVLAEVLSHQLEQARETIRALEAPRTHTAPNLTAQAPEPVSEKPLRPGGNDAGSGG